MQNIIFIFNTYLITTHLTPLPDPTQTHHKIKENIFMKNKNEEIILQIPFYL